MFPCIALTILGNLTVTEFKPQKVIQIFIQLLAAAGGGGGFLLPLDLKAA